jgi:hypothetical protein
MKTHYDGLANYMGYHKGDKVWLYCPTCMKGKSPNLQFSYEVPYKVVTWINYVVYRIQQTLSSGSHLIREPLGMTDLKEGSVGEV